MEIGTKVQVFNTASGVFQFNAQIMRKTTTSIQTPNEFVEGVPVFVAKNLDWEESGDYVFFVFPTNGKYMSRTTELYAV